MPKTAVMRTTTAEFCEHLVEVAQKPLPAAVADAARRSLFNVLGTAVGAANSPAVEAILAAAHELSAPGTVPVLGRAELLEHLARHLAAHLGTLDLTDADIWDASTVATLDAVQQKYAAKGKTLSVIGLDGASQERLDMLSGRLGAGH